MKKDEVDLTSVFQSVTRALSENQQSLDAADGYNGDHGTNMVRTFQTITAALEKKQTSSDSAALSYAAKQLSKSASSGSAKVYAEHLNQAAAQFKGKTVDNRGALQLLQTLIGGGQASQPEPASGGGDLLGALLGGMGGAQQTQQSSGGGDLLGSLLGGMGGAQQPQQSSGGGDLLGALLGGMGGAQQPQQSSGGGDLLGALLGGMGGAQQPQQSSGGGDLLGALLGGMGGAQQPQQSSGGGNLIGTLLSALVSSGALTSLVQSFLGGSKMGEAAHRSQSTELVVQSFLQALGTQNPGK